MKKLITTTFILGLTLLGIGQKVSFTPVTDDPMQVSKLEANVNATLDMGVPLDERLDGYLNLGYQLSVSYFPLAEKFSAKIDLQKGADIINSLNYSRFEAVGTFTFAKKVKTAPLPLVLSRKTTPGYYGNTTSTTFITTDQSRQTNFELRGGLGRDASPLAFVEFPEYGRGFWLHYRSTTLAAGIQMRKFHFYQARLEKWGLATSSNMVETYVDVLLALPPGFDVTADEGVIVPTTEEIKNNSDVSEVMRSTGIRGGFKYTDARHKLFSWTAGCEIGYSPSHNTIHSHFYFGAALNFLR